MKHASSFGEALLRLPTISRRSARKLRRVLDNLRGPNAARWQQLLEQSPLTHWLVLARWIARDRARTPLTIALFEAIKFAMQIGSADFLNRRIEIMADRLKRGVAPALLHTWIEIEGGLGLYAHLPKEPACREFPLDRVLRFADNDTIAVDAWRLATKWPGAIAFFNDPRIDSLSTEQKEALFELATEYHSVATIDAWPLLEAVEKLGNNTKFGDLTYTLWRTPHRAVPAIVARWAGFDERARRGLEAIVATTRDTSVETITAFAALDTRVFLEAARLARRNNQTIIVRRGLAVCFEVAPKQTLAWLVRNAEATFDFAAELITLGETRARRLLRQWTKHDLFSPITMLANDPSALVALDRLVTAHRAIAQNSPHFRTWDLHFAGTKVLGKVAIEETGNRLLADLPLLQLRHLEAQVRAQFAVSKDKHACMLHANLEFARRAFSRFLKRYESGHDQRIEHASNQQWLRRNANFNTNVWLHPLKITLPVEGLGDVTIAPETNPFELLKLGTYVDSCLAAWSFNCHNAVAVLLDVNKRVLFARNSKGHFLGRQIIAITKTNELACHSVYPHSATKSLLDLFALYDEDLAMQLGIPIAKHNDYSQVIEPVVVREWYNDGLWDRF